MTSASPTTTATGPNLVPLALLLVTIAAGVLLVALAYDGARDSRAWADALFWVALLVIVLPVGFRLAGDEASRGERLTLVIGVALALYAVKILLSPNGFVLHDELGHYRSVADILRTGKLYTPNPIVPAYAYYPGILTATAALSRLSGLGIFASGVVVVGVARVLLVGGLFMLIRRVSRSSRIAGLAVLLYAANPNFVFFDSQFAYESFALGFAAMTLWATSRAFEQPRVRRSDFAIVALLDAALVLSHHLTSYAVALALVLWALIKLARRRSLRDAAGSLALAGFSLAITAAYAVWSWPETESDIGGSVKSSIHGLITVITGQVAGKHPFTSAPGYPNPPLEQIVGVVSVALLLLALPLGLYAAWRRRPRTTGTMILAICALLYPASLALRLTAAGSETSNRTSEFVFAGLGAVLAIAFVTCLGRDESAHGMNSRLSRLIATVYVGLVFAGGVTVGNPPYQLLPAGFEVAASNRSIDQEGVQAARWAARLPAGDKSLADETDSELFGAYSRLVPQRGEIDGVGIGSLFTSTRLGAAQLKIITFDKLAYLIVDGRDSTELPAAGQYFDGADPQSAYAHPIPARSLSKFSRSACIDRVFSSGNITVYGDQALLAGCR